MLSSSNINKTQLKLTTGIESVDINKTLILKVFSSCRRFIPSTQLIVPAFKIKEIWQTCLAKLDDKIRSKGGAGHFLEAKGRSHSLATRQNKARKCIISSVSMIAFILPRGFGPHRQIWMESQVEDISRS